MKTKTFKKKLVLNKKTIADLNNGQLGKIKGGKTGPTQLISVCVCQVPTENQTCPDTCDTCTCISLYGGCPPYCLITPGC
ncbi:MAG: hypothetical protein GTO45_31135 [Candidatus Aminicenantes bacterium]|nr:hypothetical protein [Candidatus Aminicenantes bacterium]NIM83253.1 hypothetical protein [Candidatus Aminicenantes bacterium]NIN22624.1 hypothetical protein [Candidatus Aminicenantes bacterium]NIN46383.1 hypothetical protein [Candidatus Aminicenantes bacterium]NIN89233.1 hypothetical protein [Candidatus Aminicenantes bacterium]